MAGPLAEHLLACRERREIYQDQLRASRRLDYGKIHDNHFGIRDDGWVYWLDPRPEDPTCPDDRLIGHSFAEAERWVIRTKPFADLPGLFAELIDLENQWDDEHEPEVDPRIEWEATYRHQQLGV